MDHSYSTDEFEGAYTYTGNDLGSVWTKEATYFRVWAPTAQTVTVRVYKSGVNDTDDLMQEIAMVPGKNGTWLVCLPGNWNGFYYTYLVTFEGNIVEACDPYARAAGVNGMRSMIIDLRSTNPEGWESDCDPNASLQMNDIILYEIHLRDFTINTHSCVKHRGKYLALTQTGTHTTSGFPTGLDHLKALGITHLHLLPVFDYGSVDESQTGKAQYNWGYDPINFNVPEGSYSSDPYQGQIRICEMKQMVKALHDNGISVVMDVVYNHIYRTNDFCFNQIVPGYFSRSNNRGQLTNASGCGNDTASERSMVRKYIVDSVNYWADEYHIDGFRFDLVGLLDITTIRQVIDTVHSKHPNVKFYGEGWDMAYGVTKPEVNMCVQQNAHFIPAFAFFNDTLRDAIRGSVFDARIPGLASGDLGRKHTYQSCFIAAPGWTETPQQIINYESCHDNYTLYDALSIALPDASREELVHRNLFAASLLLLAQGVPFLHAGEELLRSKQDSKSGRFIANSYRSPDRVNSIKWDHLNLPEVQVVLHYYQGLIQLRKKFAQLRMKSSREISVMVNTYKCSDPSVWGYILYGNDSRLFIAFNAGNDTSELTLPKGTWEILVQDQSAGIESLGTATHSISISSVSTLVLVQKRN